VESLEIQYGLWHKKEKKLLRFTSSSNPRDSISNDTTIELNTYGDSLWIIDSSINAGYVRKFSTEWYNAGHRTPMHPYEPDELIVARIAVRVKIDEEETNTHIPDSREFFTRKYQKTNPDHLKYLLEILDKGGEIGYSLYELEEWIKERIKENKAKYEARSKQFQKK